MWELEPRGYHVVNVLLHGSNAILLWMVLRRLEVPGAWFAAAVFAVHPVFVESVAWVTERKNVLSGFFYLAAMLAYFGSESRLRGNLWSLIFFLCALLSKTVTCSLPAVIVLILWWKHGRVTRRDWMRLAPMFGLGLVMAGVTVYMEKTYVGAAGKDWELSAVDRILIAGRALWFYAGKLIWPVNLTFMYPRWTIDSTDWRQFLFPTAALGVIVALWVVRHRVGRGPLVSVLIFAGTLVPALGFFDVYPMRYSFVADHFQYLAAIPLIALAVAAATRVSQNLFLGAERVAVLLGVGLLLALGAFTWRQTFAYENRETLWTDTIRKNPDCWMAHYNLGKLYLERKQYADAERHLTEAVKIKPDMLDGYSELGVVYGAQGRIDDANEQFAKVLAQKPDHEQTILNLGVISGSRGEFAAAAEQFRRVLEINPRNAQAWYNLGAASNALGDLSSATDHLQKAVEINPLLEEAYREMAEIQLRLDRANEAVTLLRQAVKLRPMNSRSRLLLARALAQTGAFGEAEAHLREGQRLAAMGH
jgi:tetratricopeptide (TPR) repeat protein